MTPYTRRKNQLKKRIVRKKNRLEFLRGLSSVVDKDGKQVYETPPTNLVDAKTWDEVAVQVDNLKEEIALLKEKLSDHKDGYTPPPQPEPHWGVVKVVYRNGKPQKYVAA